jgi:hypothetical protein
MALTPVRDDGLHPLNLSRSGREPPNVRGLETSRNIARHGYEKITGNGCMCMEKLGIAGWRSGMHNKAGMTLELQFNAVGHRTELVELKYNWERTA